MQLLMLLEKILTWSNISFLFLFRMQFEPPEVEYHGGHTNQKLAIVEGDLECAEI